MAGTELASFEDAGNSDWSAGVGNSDWSAGVGSGTPSFTNRLTSFFTRDAAESDEIKRVREKAAALRKKKEKEAESEFRGEKNEFILGEEQSETEARVAAANRRMNQLKKAAREEEKATIAAALEAERVEQARSFEDDDKAPLGASSKSEAIQRDRRLQKNKEIEAQGKQERDARELAEANAWKVKNADIAWAEKNRFRVPSKPGPTTTAPSTLSRFKGMLGLGGRTRKRKHRSRSKKTKTIQRRRKSYARKSTNKRRRPHKRFTRRY